MIDLLSAGSVLGAMPCPKEWPCRWAWTSDNRDEIVLLWFAYRATDDSYSPRISRLFVVPDHWDVQLVLADGVKPDANTLIEAAQDIDRDHYRLDDGELVNAWLRLQKRAA